MTLKRFILLLITAFALAKVALSLGGSLEEPQVQGRLDLYQADLILQANVGEVAPDRAPLRAALLGADPYEAVAEKYAQARTETVALGEKLQERLQTLQSSERDAEGDTTPIAEKPNPAVRQLQEARRDLHAFIAEIDLKQGWLEAERGDLAAAQADWDAATAAEISPFTAAAEISQGLWQDPPEIAPDARVDLERALQGWYRDRALARLYVTTDRPEELAALEARERVTAEAALSKLATIGAIPMVAALIGIGLLLFLGIQWLLAREDSLLGRESDRRWETPWDAEITWQVIVIGFFGVSQFVLPLLLGLAGLDPSGWGIRGKAAFVFATYLIMAIGGIAVMWVSIRPYFPLPEGWFSLKGNWLGWGLGGYFAAVPLVIAISAVNQQIWQGQGGSNPLLYLAVQAQDRVALGLFLVTAAVLAPVFEELMFRGFLLPALTRYFPVWGAIALSAILFSLAHLSLSEFLPLAVLGSVLGFVYARSRSLLASILLHGLWNSGTLASLFVLGSGVN